jgi:hypothetical protein
MTVVRFKRRRRRLSMRYYLCTDTGPVRLPPRLCRDLAGRLVALPQFANSVQRMVEVLIQSKVGKIEKIELRPTHSRFDENGKIDLRHAAEAMAIILGGSAPKQVGENVVDIRSILSSQARERETKWRIPPSLKKLILADVKGETKLPIISVRPA